MTAERYFLSNHAFVCCPPPHSHGCPVAKADTGTKEPGPGTNPLPPPPPLPTLRIIVHVALAGQGTSASPRHLRAASMVAAADHPLLPTPTPSASTSGRWISTCAAAGCDSAAGTRPTRNSWAVSV
ncbi:hypothetical protein E2562_039300 [Oryza meyeriana var. granulata]|uniref:Uncharacterized protein n=1 Tax=Oryza meyeriana var. granulata TaxID=110450 RepID=A0A6G1DW23_9ORYZ|nr:hypothetical protein E2562_039300 [Oryza meyeriana var. granulata]KAF0915874.1 hypothetical protein E2562_039300 [Oryza meyeriana var. granulata]